MRYREMIKKVQQYSGFSDSESESALVALIRIISGRLTPDERMDFASQLPAELQDTVVAAEEHKEASSLEDILDTIIDEQNVDEDHAKKQIKAVWQTLNDAISEGEIDDIKAQLPLDMSTLA